MADQNETQSDAESESGAVGESVSRDDLSPKTPKNGNSSHEALSTGIPGLDAILGGGFPAERLYVVEGQPGSGKTTLALRFLIEGRDRGERGLYVTLSETYEEVDGVAQTHDWSLDGIDFLDMSSSPVLTNPESQYTVFHPSEVELQDTVSAVLARVDEVQPRRVVLDSLSEMRLLARDPLRFRRQILALKQFFAERGTTVLLLDDQTTEGIDMPLHSLAHGVVRLEQMVLAHGAERRQIRVPKLRGVNFHSGYHDFVIRTGGLEVFPRIRLDTDPGSGASGWVSSGSPRLDNLLGGGLVRGTSALLTGAPGTGKSILASQYAFAAAERDERVAIYLFDERLHTFIDRSNGLGIDIARHIDSGRISVTSLEPTEISPGEFTSRLTRAADDDVQIVVVDSLNGFTQAMAQERQITSKIHELLSHLGSRGVTTLLTLAQRGIFGAPADDSTEISYLADAVVLLRYFEAQGDVHRAISAVKQRSAANESTIREFRIGEGGVHLGEPLRDFQGVLLGVPTYTGGGAQLLHLDDGEH